MSEFKGTPGPWHGKRDGRYAESAWYVDHEDMGSFSWVPVVDDQGETICLAVSSAEDDDECHLRENARLIASAPELLEFAKEWLGRQGSDDNHMTRKARVAIAKATGEDQ